MGRLRTFTAATAGSLTVMALIALSSVSRLRAQSQPADAPLPSFEVASIKPDTSNANMIRLGGPDVSRFTASNVTAKMLVTTAYEMRDFQVSGGPGWISSERFDIDAKVEDSLAQQLRGLPRDQQQHELALMLRSLLADRFKLQVTHQSKELPVFALVVAKGGSKLTEAAVPAPSDPQAPAAPPPPGRGDAPGTPPPGTFMMSIGRGGVASMTAKAVPMPTFVKFLSQSLGQQVVDRTGLSGNYDVNLHWTTENGLGGAPLMPSPEAADAGGTSIFTVLQEQLGLRLESTKGPVDTITIDHIEEPSEN